MLDRKAISSFAAVSLANRNQFWLPIIRKPISESIRTISLGRDPMKIWEPLCYVMTVYQVRYLDNFLYPYRRAFL